MGIEVREGQAIALFAVFVEGMDRILEAARFADNGDGAVAQGDELAQAARFVPRRHEEHVGSGIDLMGQGFIEGNIRRYLRRMTAGQFAEGIFIACIAGPNQNQLDIVIDEFIHDARDQVQALVFDEARDHGDHGDAALDAQAQFGPQGIFTACRPGRWRQNTVA